MNYNIFAMSKNMDSEKKECQNCCHFVKHFVNTRGIFTAVVGCGHCLNRSAPLHRSKKHVHKFTSCELWEPIELQKEERKASIERTLQSMQISLSEIAQILKDDN